MEPSEIPTVPPQLPPIHQGNKNMVESNRRTSPPSNWREHQQLHTTYDDDDDIPREGLSSSRSYSYSRNELWANSNPDESCVGDDAFYHLRVSQSTQSRFGLPPLNTDITQHQLRSKSIDRIPCASYPGIVSRPRSRDSTQAQSGSICQESEELGGEFDPEAIRYFRSLTPVEIEWKPPPGQGELSPLSDTESDLASVYLPSLVPGARRPRPLTPFPDYEGAEELTETPLYTAYDRSQILKIRHRTRNTPEDEEYHKQVDLGPLSTHMHFKNVKEMRMDADDAKELSSTTRSTSTESPDQELEYFYQDFEDFDQDLENQDKDLEGSHQNLENHEQNLDDSDKHLGDPDGGSYFFIRHGDNLQGKEKLGTEPSEAELGLNRELETAWEKYEHEQTRYFNIMAKVREEQEQANRWRLGALERRLSYTMLKAELDEKTGGAGH